MTHKKLRHSKRLAEIISTWDRSSNQTFFYLKQEPITSIQSRNKFQISIAEFWLFPEIRMETWKPAKNLETQNLQKNPVSFVATSLQLNIGTRMRPVPPFVTFVGNQHPSQNVTSGRNRR